MNRNNKVFVSKLTCEFVGTILSVLHKWFIEEKRFDFVNWPINIVCV